MQRAISILPLQILKMKVLVTGADGLLGSNLVRKLIDKGHDVVALIQPGRKVATLEGLPIKKAEGDILDTESLMQSVESADAIYHLAANTNIWPNRSPIIYKVNFDGTKNVIALAKKLKVKRFIFVGTANSFSYGSKEKPGVEGTPFISKKYELDYMDSKYAAQQHILNEVKDGFPALILNPTFMIGPYDSMPSSGKMVVAIKNQSLPGYAPGGKNYVNAVDAATAAANALTMGRIGQCYILGGENLTFLEAFQKMAQVVGSNAPKIKMPKPILLAFGYVSGLFAKITKKPPQVSYAMAQIACDTHYYSPKKAVDELDLPQRPIEEGIKECYQWLNENGYFAK